MENGSESPFHIGWDTHERPSVTPLAGSRWLDVKSAGVRRDSSARDIFETDSGFSNGKQRTLLRQEVIRPAEVRH